MIRLLAVASVVLADCTATSARPAAPQAHGSLIASGPSRSQPASSTGPQRPSVAAVSARTLCRAALPRRTVLAWADTNVGALRSYQYSGPVPHIPLQSAFPGTPADHVAVWCWVRNGPDSGSLWGAVAGQPARRAVTVTGPGWRGPRGQMDRVPQPP